MPPVIEWVALVGLVLLLAFLIPGFSLLMLFRLELRKRDVGLMLVYSLGVGLVVMPLSLYWANFFGIDINMFWVIVVTSMVVGVSGVVQLVTALRKRPPL